jgi:aryl-alcohol dehydrogenase-like predicted oxidoreductase
MRARRLGYTDLHLTTIGLGTWAIGGPWDRGWGPQDDADSLATIHRALDLGINWIDTAAIYGLGHSEEVVGEAIQGRRDDVVVATKCSRVWDPKGGTISGRLTAKGIREECEASLRRLRIDVIDLYQIHWPTPDEDIEEGWTTIAELITAGKVRYGGVSNFSIPQLQRAQSIHPVASLQPPYSMLQRGVEEELLAYCATHEIGVVAYSPMQAGLLTGKFTRDRVAHLPADDWRKGNRHFQPPALDANLDLVDGLRPLAERNGLTLAQLSIAWVLRRPELTAAIVGARRPSQIEETAQAADHVLSLETVEEIARLLSRRDQALVD